MGLREAYKMVIKHQLDLLEEEEEWFFENKDKLVEKLHENESLQLDFKETIHEHFEMFGDDYDLW
jgi:hypothetical protein